MRALATSAGGMKLSCPDIWNASAAVAGYSCLNSAGSLQLADLVAPPGHLREVETVEPPILASPPGRAQSRPAAACGIRPASTTARRSRRNRFRRSRRRARSAETVAHAVGGALQDDLGAGHVGHGLQHAGRVASRRAARTRPRSRGRAGWCDERPDALGAGGADPVAGVERVEAQLLGVGGAGRGRTSSGQCAWKRSTISNRFCVAASSWVRMNTRRPRSWMARW